MNPVHILLVEDNEGDILLTQEAFEECKINTQLSVVKNGVDALDFIFKRGTFRDVDKPDLILLDINLPIKNGHEVLEIIKNDDKTKRIPVIMLTTSSNEKDINKAYQNYANSYVIKPIEMDEFMSAISKIEEFWLEVVKFSS